MKRPDLAFAFTVSLALHATLFLVFSSYQEARVTFKPGVSAVTLNIVPSVASRAATPTAAPPVKEPPQQKPVVEPPPPPPPKPQPKPVVRPPELKPKPEPLPVPPPPPSEPPPKPAPAVQKPVPAPVARPKPAAQAPKPPAAPAAPVQAPAPAKTATTGPDAAAAVNSANANADLAPHGVTAEASAVNLTQPEYPFYSRRHGEEGTVVVEVQVLAAGRPGRITVVKSSGYSRLDRAAVTALKEASYVAARRAGVPITTTKRFAFTFKLEGTETR